jgi:hypothetical protein
LLGPAAEISLPGDSLVAPTVMGFRARSKLLVYMHQKFRALQVVINLGAHLSFSHEYGVGNPICDMLSRGRPREACTVMRHLRLGPTQVEVPHAALEFLADIMRYFRTLPRSDEAWMHEPRSVRRRRPIPASEPHIPGPGTTRAESSCAMGDGPASPWPMPVAPARPSLAAEREAPRRWPRSSSPPGARAHAAGIDRLTVPRARPSCVTGAAPRPTDPPTWARSPPPRAARAQAPRTPPR